MPPDAVAQIREWPLRAYFDSIRSVLFVDDQFPTYASPESGKEGARARVLWNTCRERGWLCDMDNATDWSSHSLQTRIASSDLLVLDYHLDGDDPTPALKIVENLAESPLPGLVVVYTSEPDLDQVLLRLSSHVRGIATRSFDLDMPEDFANMEEQVEWSEAGLFDYLHGGSIWEQEFVDACKLSGLDPTDHMDVGRSLIERWFGTTLGAPRLVAPRPVDRIETRDGVRWLQCGNLFLTVVGKPGDESSLSDANVLIDGLVLSIRAWNPPWLACLVAHSRREANQGSFRDDLILPNEHLQHGLLHYVRSATDEEERSLRSRYVAADLLSRRFTAATSVMGARVLEGLGAGNPSEPAAEALLHANAFLCSDRHEGHHIRVGSIFRTPDRSQYWVCVTPACDMVPRPRNQSIDPWGHSLGDTRALTVIRLDTTVDAAKALKNSEEGRFLFFLDQDGAGSSIVIAAAAMNVKLNDPLPKVEQMFARNLARKDPNNQSVDLIRVAAGEDGRLTLTDQICTVVCQLRAPYAERLTHVVGGHVSRVGVDFLTSKKRS